MAGPGKKAMTSQLLLISRNEKKLRNTIQEQLSVSIQINRHHPKTPQSPEQENIPF
jgi:hypothetical protein